jgi:hypothetical protein
MTWTLAYAEQSDLSGSGWTIVLLGLAVIVAVAILAAAPIGVARGRGNPWAGNIVVATLLWGLVTGGSLLYTVWVQTNWQQERSRLIATGYFDPRSQMGAPSQPWWLWIGLGVAYAALIGAALSRRPSDESGP